MKNANQKKKNKAEQNIAQREEHSLIMIPE